MRRYRHVIVAALYAGLIAACLPAFRRALPRPWWFWSAGRPAAGSARFSSLALLRGKLYAKERGPARRDRRRPGRKRSAQRLVLDPMLRDALNTGTQSGFWARALDGITAARRESDGKVSSRRYRSAAIRGGRAAKSRRAGTAVSAGKERKRTAKVPAAHRRRGQAATAAAAGSAERRHSPRRAAGGKTRAPDFDGRRARGGSFGSGDSGLRYNSLHSARTQRKDKEPRRGKIAFKPPKLSAWLGKGALKPPAEDLEAPSFSALKGKYPERLPDGKPYTRKTPGPAHVERLVPPGEHPKYERWLEKDAHRGRKDEPHWHIDAANVPFYHMGTSWGRADSGRWTWLIRKGKRWWTVAAGAQRMVRHAEHWWWKTRDGWFLLHAGEPWAYRHFADWRRQGFIHPRSGTRIVYSADGARVAVVAPDGSARLFDARTGEFIAAFPRKENDGTVY
ncbi:MAG: hypothetical protein ABIJ96_04645 [Elusimicrobiota bacterium]